jgi:hypothetical protein
MVNEFIAGFMKDGELECAGAYEEGVLESPLFIIFIVCPH